MSRVMRRMLMVDVRKFFTAYFRRFIKGEEKGGKKSKHSFFFSQVPFYLIFLN